MTETQRMTQISTNHFTPDWHLVPSENFIGLFKLIKILRIRDIKAWKEMYRTNTIVYKLHRDGYDPGCQKKNNPVCCGVKGDCDKCIHKIFYNPPKDGIRVDSHYCYQLDLFKNVQNMLYECSKSAREGYWMAPRHIDEEVTNDTFHQMDMLAEWLSRMAEGYFNWITKTGNLNRITSTIEGDFQVVISRKNEFKKWLSDEPSVRTIYKYTLSIPPEAIEIPEEYQSVFDSTHIILNPELPSLKSVFEAFIQSEDEYEVYKVYEGRYYHHTKMYSSRRGILYVKKDIWNIYWNKYSFMNSDPYSSTFLDEKLFPPETGSYDLTDFRCYDKFGFVMDPSKNARELRRKKLISKG